MLSKLLLALVGTLVGLAIGYICIVYAPLQSTFHKEAETAAYSLQKHDVIGFLPYWLIGKSKKNYVQAITTLAYFNLTVGTDGTIRKLSNPQEREPGWNALASNAVDQSLRDAKREGKKLSLVVFNGDSAEINELISDPAAHAKNLVADVTPLMHTYGFTDLNLDIESVEDASDEARIKFTAFTQEVKQRIASRKLGTLTIEVSPTDLIKKRLIDTRKIGGIADHVVVMAYDFHYAGSSVTGPVAPLGGAGTIAEYDTQTAVRQALGQIPAQKIILGIPLYGYEWETIDPEPRSAIIPGTGITASSSRIQSFLRSCATCSAQLDTAAQEPYITYKDTAAGSYHQIFYPDKNALQAKVDFAQQQQLSGLALWALGYEDADMLAPLSQYVGRGLLR